MQQIDVGHKVDIGRNTRSENAGKDRDPICLWLRLSDVRIAVMA
ncbi:9449_t:CDS:2, partial [Cetraspora pellucida]